MKSIKSFLLIIAGIAALVFAFQVGTASASTGCFPDTNAHWAETFICWMKDNAISSGYPDGTFKPENAVTRAEMSVMLSKVNDLANTNIAANLATAKAYTDTSLTGQILITMGQSSWSTISDSANITLTKNYAFTTITKPTAGANVPVLGFPDLPHSLYGRSLAISGVEICYDASLSPANVFLNTLQAYVDTQSSGTNGPFVILFTDPTDRTDAACRYYSFTPVTLTADSIVSVGVFGSWSNNASLEVGRATFVLTPTTTVSNPPSAAPENPFELPPLTGDSSDGR